MKTLLNGAFGLASASGTWLVGTMEHLESGFRLLGVIAGSLAACLSLAIAWRNWRKRPAKAS